MNTSHREEFESKCANAYAVDRLGNQRIIVPLRWIAWLPEVIAVAFLLVEFFDPEPRHVAILSGIECNCCEPAIFHCLFSGEGKSGTG